MNWLQRMLCPKPRLDVAAAGRLAVCRQYTAPARNTTIGALRWVVLDVETTGLNPYADRLISIGAVELVDFRIRLDRPFEVVLRQPHASTRDNILIHGIDGTTQCAGAEPADALLQFLEFAQSAPLVGFHADFDRAMIERACREFLGHTPENPWFDLAFLLPSLLGNPDGPQPSGLDGWLAHFGIVNHARHQALSDALATAQLMQIAWRSAVAAGAAALGDLQRTERDQRWLTRC